MAVGLSFLGRGTKGRTIRVVLIHIIGAAIGGSVVGGLLGWIGWQLSLPTWRTFIVGATVIWALVFSVRSRGGLGIRRQVPKAWSRTMSVDKAYFFWGVLLGSSVVTIIPYSFSLVVLSAQLTSGVTFGAVSGALYGGVRQFMTIVPLIGQWAPNRSMALLPKSKALAIKLNLFIVLIGGALLIVGGAF